VKPALVVLAAGASERLGRCKALVALGRGTPLELLLRAGEGMDGAAPLVIAGADHGAIEAAAPEGVEVAFNEDWARGRSGGVRVARRLRPGADLCLAPVDVPMVPREVFAALAEEWAAAGAPARGWLAPFVEREGRRRFGHPVVVGRELLLELEEMGDGAPLRDLRGRAEPVLAVEVEAREILDDLDTEEDLERLRERARRG
jgi:molybdenum cofactor cytidylyltransferase